MRVEIKTAKLNEIMNKILLYSDRPTKFEVFYDSEKCIESIKDYLKLAL